MGFSFDPAAIALIALAEWLYLRGVAVLRGRGYAVPRHQRAAWHVGIALTAIGLLSPVDGLGEDLLSAHMAQHLLIADLAVPLLLVGLHSPMHVFFLPRPATVALARSRLRPVFRKLRRPLVALPIWILILYGWHFAFLFEAALRSDLLHAVQHEMFVLGAVLIWWPVIEPKRRRTPGELWKIGHILGARLAGMFLGMAFILMSSPAYEGFYGDSAREHGLAPLTDQQIAGGMMLGIDLLVMLGTVAFFFWRSAEDHDRAAARAAAPLAALAALVAGAALLSGCGGEERTDEEVIRAWSTAVNSGRYGEAADLFANDALVQQARAFRLPDRDAAIEFNRALPCRATVTSVEEVEGGALASFRLREGRRGECGPGAGQGEPARVKFVIRDGLILEWRQLPTRPLPPGSAA